MDLDYIGLTIRKLYDIIVQNWLMIILTVIILWLAMLALNRPEPENKTIIQIELDIDKIDQSLTNIEKTIDEIFGKLEVEIKQSKE
tara:strand:+ start:226 stop:483 length:258 start_codon:yes stop_codon:yes gene_type:complete